MDKKMLQKTFREYKKVAGLDYAITNPDGLGDCSSCVNDALCNKYGIDSHGVWVKEWTRGMNASDGIDKLDRVYVAHDLDAEQAILFYEVFTENYYVLPEEYDPYICFQLFEKNTNVYKVTFTNSDGYECSDVYTDLDKAMSRVETLIMPKYFSPLDGEYFNNPHKSVTIDRLF